MAVRTDLLNIIHVSLRANRFREMFMTLLPWRHDVVRIEGAAVFKYASSVQDFVTENRYLK